LCTFYHSRFGAKRIPSIQKEKVTVQRFEMSDSDSDSSVGSIIEDSEPDTTTFKCLFCEQEWSCLPEMTAHCRSEHSFDLEGSIKSLGPGS
jgi:hypothetical protein